ncbi:MAG: glycosyltransferase family 4 protein [Mariprofundales bacterium]
MRIAYLALIELDVPNACLIHTREISENMEKLGHQVELFLPRPLRLESWQIACHHWVRFWGFDPMRRLCFMIEAMLRLMIAHWQCNFDVLYLREVESPRLLRRWCQLLGIPIVIEVNGWLLDDLKLLHASAATIRTSEKNQHQLLSTALAVVASTEGNANNVIRHYAVPAARVMVQELGVNVEHFSGIVCQQARERLGLECGKWLLFAGSFHPHHDLHSVVNAFALLHQQHADIRLALVGDGAQRAIVQQWVEELQLTAVVRFTGSRPYEEMPQWFAAADIILSPLHVAKIRQQNGGLATKVWEAMASGTAVVVTDLPECGSWALLEHMAWLCPPEDPAAMAATIMEALDGGAKADARREIAQCYVQEQRSWRKAAEETLAFIVQRLAEKS